MCGKAIIFTAAAAAWALVGAGIGRYDTAWGAHANTAHAVVGPPGLVPTVRFRAPDGEEVTARVGSVAWSRYWEGQPITILFGMKGKGQWDGRVRLPGAPSLGVCA